MSDVGWRGKRCRDATEACRIFGTANANTRAPGVSDGRIASDLEFGELAGRGAEPQRLQCGGLGARHMREKREGNGTRGNRETAWEAEHDDLSREYL
jgi:hypothetical protein